MKKTCFALLSIIIFGTLLSSCEKDNCRVPSAIQKIIETDFGYGDLKYVDEYRYNGEYVYQFCYRGRGWLFGELNLFVFTNDGFQIGWAVSSAYDTPARPLYMDTCYEHFLDNRVFVREIFNSNNTPSVN